MTLAILTVMAAIGLSPMAALAVPIQWTFSGAVFDDGGTATGSFVYEADTNVYSNINVITTAGTSFAGTPYVAFPPSAVVSSTFFYPVDSTAAHLGAAGAHSLSLFFLSPLSNAGGTVNLLTLAGPSAGSRENLCDPPFADCSGAA